MRKLILLLPFPFILLTSCGYSGDVTKEDGGIYCYEGYSYIRIDGDTEPSPSTLDGYVDFACPQD